MAPLGTRALFWHTVKTFVFFKLFTHFRLKLKSTKIFAITLVSLISSGLVYKLVDYLVDKILCYMLNLETMNVMDDFFMNTEVGKPPNTSALLKTNRFDFERAKSQFIQKIEAMP